MRGARIVVTVAGLALAAASSGFAGATPREAPRTGLPDGGPAILHEPLAKAPQLENTGDWRAKPILVSGASAYRSGEFLYQDFLYDDLGDGSSPYPAGTGYAGNAADFVELRVKPQADATLVRITYNSLVNPSLTAATLALGGKANGPASTWPHGARATSPAKVFVTVHGSSADAVDAATGKPVRAALGVRVDPKRFQVEVRIPHSLIDPTGDRAFRMAAGTGVWDAKTAGYLAPDDGAALYNLAFRYDETTHPRGIPVATWFRDTGQKAALSDGDVSHYSASIDFRKLAARTNDDMSDQAGGVPVHGSMSRINVTHFSPAPGRGTVSDQPTSCDHPCSPEFAGRLQQYFVHVPRTRPAHGYGLAIYNHGCGNNQNEMFGSKYAEGLSRLNGGTILMAANGRGACLWYQGISGASIFETWADVASHYSLDPTHATVTGYSMGGYGTFMLATTYPELFGRALAIHPCTETGVVPAASENGVEPLVASLRHVPLAVWASVNDPLCQYVPVRQVVKAVDDHSYAYNLFTLNNDHFTDVTNDILTPAINWLANGSVAANPGVISYVVKPGLSFPKYGLDPANHVYWLSGLRTRAAGLGTVEAVSGGLGEGAATAQPVAPSSGVVTGGDLGPFPYTEELRDPGAVPAVPRANRLQLTLRNIAAVDVDTSRAGLTCSAKVAVDTDVPVTVRLLGCPKATRTFAPSA